MKNVQAVAHSNIALIKYWGKRPDTDPTLNLPAVGSLSMTLDGLRTETAISEAGEDAFELDGRPQQGIPAQRVFGHLDRVWSRGRRDARPRCKVASTNHFPTAAGLASSASGFAALTAAAAAAFELGFDDASLSALARMGSGSAARSIFGGFVRLDRGDRDDGWDCVARPLDVAADLSLRLVVVETTRGPKSVTSTDGMERSRQTSPYYGPWVDTSPADLDAAERALEAGDLERLGGLVEHSALKMHACMMATRPPLLYWNGATVTVMQEVWRARAGGLLGYVTIDAGPHVKLLCTTSDAATWEARCRDIPGVEAVSVCAPGPGVSAREVLA